MQSAVPSNPSSVETLPIQIVEKLIALRGLITRFVVSQAFLLLAIWLVAAFWAFGAIDYLPAKMGASESPKAVRAVMLALLVGVSSYLIYQFLWQRWRVRWTDSSLALLIENKHPEFESSLVTTVQAARPSRLIDQKVQAHPARLGLLQLARERATQLIEQVDVAQLVQFRPLQLQMIALGGLLATSCVLGLSQPAWTMHWAKRFLALSDTPWPRMAQLGVEGIELDVPTFTGRNTRQRYIVPFLDGVASVPKGQACQLKTWANLASKLVPEVCTVYYRDEAGNRGRANMRRLPADHQRQPFVLDGPPLESVNDSLWLSVAGGDARISNLQIQSVDAPAVTQMELAVTYPEYLQRSTKTIWGSETLPYRTGIRIPQGSQLNLQVQANTPVQRCEYIVVRSGDTRDKSELPEESVTVQAGQSGFQLPLGSLDSNSLIEIRLWGQNGICSSKVQQFVISTIEDQAPQVDLVLQGIGTAVTENAILPVAGKVQDDYDVKDAWLESVLDDQPVHKTPLSVQADGKATDALDLKVLRDSGQLMAKVGSTLGLNLAAEDYLDSRSEPHIGRASPIQLNVVTADQLLILLERRELAMRARLEQIIGELSQMRDLLVIMQKAALAPANEPPTAGSEDSQTTANADGDAGNSESNEDNSPARRARMQTLRSQQALAQLVKSEGELRGVEREIHQITQELINNRIDSADRRTRLEDKIRQPLLGVLDRTWPPLSENLHTLEKSGNDAKGASVQTPDKLLPDAVAKSNQVIAELTAILNDMIDIQDFNELVDMVRGMIDEQNKVLEKTKQEQKKQLLDLLK